MGYYFSRQLDLSFNEAIAKITQTLQQEGFGIINTIDIKDTLKQELNIDFRNYKILEACNPQFAFNAISLESHIGLMFPCNIVVQEHENGEIEVSAINRLEMIDKAFSTTSLKEIAAEVGIRLRIAIDDLHREGPHAKHEEALPSSTRENSIISPISRMKDEMEYS